MPFGNFGRRRHAGFRRQGVLPPAIKYLLLTTGAFYLAQWVLAGTAPGLYRLLFSARGGLLPLQPNLNPALGPFAGLFKPWQLVTYMFLHSGMLHIGVNMFMLWIFGVEVEERWGTRHFLVFYFLSGIGGGILQMIVPPLLGQTPSPVVGASGAVAGVLLAFGMMFPNRMVPVPIFIIIPVPARTMVLIYAAVEIVRGVGFGGVTGIAHFAHLGGMLFGYLYIKYQQRKRRFYRE